MLIVLHAEVHVEFEVDGVSKTIESTVIVNQGNVLGPFLFVIYMAAVRRRVRRRHRRRRRDGPQVRLNAATPGGA